jgi:hypothetical protein
MFEYPRKMYGDNSWIKGKPYDPKRCAKEVWPLAGWGSRQCTRPSGHGDRELFCKQHAKRMSDLPESGVFSDQA